MEVVSPGPRRLDLLTKVREYAAAGIPEYWAVDPETLSVAVYVIKGETYDTPIKVGAGGTVRSVTLAGFELAVDGIMAAR